MRWGRSLAAGIAIAAVAVIVVAAAPAKPTDDDVGVVVCLSTEGTCRTDTKTGPNFQLSIRFTTRARPAVLQKLTVTIGLPPGLRWGSDGPDPSEDCTGTAPAVCTGGGGSWWAWDVVAEQVGFYEVTATVEAEQPDPDLSNNTFTFRFEVVQPTGSAVHASAVKLSPAKPKAGAIVAATVRVTAGGAPVTPTGVACTGAVAGSKLRGTPRAGPGAATCRYRTPKRAKGRTLRGAVSFSARGQRLTRRFAVRLR